MRTPEAFWAADIGSGWVPSPSREMALTESAQYLRRGHAMLMRRMTLAELIRRRAGEIVHGERLLEVLAESDGDVEWCYNPEANPLGEYIDDDTLSAIAEAGVRAMMAEADRRGLLCDGCVLLKHVHELKAVSP